MFIIAKNKNNYNNKNYEDIKNINEIIEKKINYLKILHA